MELHSSIKTGRSGCKLSLWPHVTVIITQSDAHRSTCFCAQSASRFGPGLTTVELGCALCHYIARVQMVLIVAGRLACSFTSMGYSGLPWVSVQLHRSILFIFLMFFHCFCGFLTYGASPLWPCSSV